MSDGEKLDDLLRERPELRTPLERLLAVDEVHETWEFEDTQVESGEFGELVSRGVVEKVDGGYRLADRQAVRTAVGDDENRDPESDPTPGLATTVRSVAPEVTVNRRNALWLVGALSVLVAVRLLPVPSVFRGDAIVLAGNDPYYYRYWVEQVLAAGGGHLNPGSLSVLPEPVLHGEPLLVATLWFFSGLLGGDTDAVGFVLAVYPVLSAIATGVILYEFSTTVTEDRRVAIGAVVFLAVTPVHAFRTSLGFADHHAFDFLWVAITSLAVLKCIHYREISRRATVAWATVLAFGIAGQSLSWNAGPLLIVPIGLFVFGDSLQAIREDTPVIRRVGPILAAVAAGATFVSVVNIALNWQRTIVVGSVWALFLGCLSVALIAETSRRRDRGIGTAVGAAVGASVCGLAGMRLFAPNFWQTGLDEIGRLVASPAIAETQSLLSFQSFGFLLLFGFGLLLAVPVIVWGLVYARDGRSVWLAAGVYAVWFFFLSLFQVRFAGELAFFVAFFDGIAFLWLAGLVDLVERPSPFGPTTVTELSVPSRTVLRGLVILFVLVASLGAVQTPIKINQIQIDDDEYQTAAWMGNYADENDYESPYVFSNWGKNRMYNYFVNGDARWYSYAQKNYDDFLTETDGEVAYERYASRARFLVTQDQDAERLAMQSRLHDHYGSAHGDTPALSRYRAVYATETGARKVFLPVPGGILVAERDPNTTISVSKDIDLPNDRFTYTQQVTTTDSGWVAARVPYPGDYQVANGTETITKPAVDSGQFNSQRTGRAYYQFDSNTGEFVFDETGGNHGQIDGAEWTTGVSGSALSFDENDTVVIDDDGALNATSQLDVSAWIKTNASDGYHRVISKTARWTFMYDGYQIHIWDGEIRAALGTNGSAKSGVHLNGDEAQVADGEWHRVRLTWNGSVATLSLDGEIVERERYTGTAQFDGPVVIGDRSTGFSGTVDEVRVNTTSVES
jgi:dolichyl-diphosphooligosaccharide--protein glycosyltransferase